MADAERWARCNFDGRALHPDDQETLDTFREWLALPAERRFDPEWHEFLGIKPGAQEDGDYDHVKRRT